ncbi:MAG: MFS transporter [Anaerolineae bacterium]|jgi:MFS family permease|nr:MFS transporter [Anaerolineae bacterium]
MELEAQETKGLFRRNGKTLFALALGYFVDQGEGQAMSVLSPILQQIWNLSLEQIGLIGTIRSLLQAISAPFWGYAADKVSRKKVIIFGTGIWGIWTTVCGLTQNYHQLLVVRAISGLGLGCLMPATFSLMSDVFPPSKRGKALGILEGMGVLGIVVGVLALGTVATPDLWRWGFIILGLMSVLTGVFIAIFVKEPVRGAAEPELMGKINEENSKLFGVKFSDIFKVLSIPTVWVAILQGLAGSMPWVVMGLYFINWMVTVRGMEVGNASVAFAIIVIGTAASNIIGGILGDWAEEKSPKYGRVIVGQVSIIAGIPMSYVMLTMTADWPLWAFILWCLLTALLISWPGKGAKEPMMQGAVQPELRSTAFAMTTFIESGFAALVAWFAGRLADQIGFTEALIWTIPVPWIICAALFSLFYWAYPRDSKRLREMMAKRAEELDGV